MNEKLFYMKISDKVKIWRIEKKFSTNRSAFSKKKSSLDSIKLFLFKHSVRRTLAGKESTRPQSAKTRTRIKERSSPFQPLRLLWFKHLVRQRLEGKENVKLRWAPTQIKSKEHRARVPGVTSFKLPRINLPHFNLPRFKLPAIKVARFHKPVKILRERPRIARPSIPQLQKKTQKALIAVIVLVIAAFLIYNFGVLAQLSNLFHSFSSSNVSGNQQQPPSPPPVQSNNKNVVVNQVTIGMNYSRGMLGSLSVTSSANSFNVTPGTIQEITLHITSYNISLPGSTATQQTITGVSSGIPYFAVIEQSPSLPTTISIGGSSTMVLEVDTPAVPYEGTLNIILDVTVS